MSKPSAKFRRACEVYLIFARPWLESLDVSPEAMEEMFRHESHGKPVGDRNGFAVGKKWLNVQVSAWKEDIAAGLLTKQELLEDETFPKWWIRGVLDA